MVVGDLTRSETLSRAVADVDAPIYFMTEDEITKGSSQWNLFTNEPYACVAAGIPRVWLHRGMGGKAAPEEAVRACRDAGIPVVDGACLLMFAAPVAGFHRFHRHLLPRRITA